MSSPLEVAIVAGIASFIGSLIVPTINYLWNEKSKNKDREINERLTERARQFDLYKVVYPEKVKAVVSLMDKASALFMDMRAYYMGAQDKQQRVELGSRLDNMFWEAKSYEFLLGEEAVKLAGEFRHICIMAFLREREFRIEAILDGDVWAHEDSYQHLSKALRQVVHLDTLEARLLPPLTPLPGKSLNPVN